MAAHPVQSPFPYSYVCPNDVRRGGGVGGCGEEGGFSPSPHVYLPNVLSSFIRRAPVILFCGAAAWPPALSMLLRIGGAARVFCPTFFTLALVPCIVLGAVLTGES